MITEAQNALGGGAGALMNLVPLPGLLTIIPVSRFDPVPTPKGLPWVTMFNQDNWSEEEKYEYRDPQPAGTNKTEQRFLGVRPKALSVELLIDGTGASGQKEDVTAKLIELRRTVGFNGDLHKPNLLFVVFGLFIFQGIIETIEIQHTLFRPNGTSLRAKVKLSFKEHEETISKILKADNKSADLTHHRMIRAGDRLDNLCNSIYGSPRFTLEVAKANGLTSFRKLPAGQELVFPPIAK